MSNFNPSPKNKLRLEIASTAARFVAEDGIEDFQTAKRKAANRIGVNLDKCMPTNFEVEQALLKYQDLFYKKHQCERLLAMRKGAIKAMRFLKDYNPKLVGPVLNGTATQHSEITIHIFCDEPETIGFLLNEHGIPFETSENTVRINNREKTDLPAYRFMAEDYSYSLIIFAEKQKNLSPVSSINRKPMQRASLEKLESMVESS